MKALGNYLPSNKSSNAPSSALDTKRGDALWVTLAGMYGSKLTSQYGVDCPLAWHRIIADLSNDELSRGLRWLRDEGREWPPAAPEFWRLCKKPEAPRPPTMMALPAPRYPKEKGRERVAELRAILRK